MRKNGLLERRRMRSMIFAYRAYGMFRLFISFFCLAGFRSGVYHYRRWSAAPSFSRIFVDFHFKYSFLSNIYTFARTYVCVFAVPYSHRLQKLFIVFWFCCLFASFFPPFFNMFSYCSVSYTYLLLPLPTAEPEHSGQI